jgi:hypothetical protein
MVAVRSGYIDQLPRRCTPRVSRSGFAANLEFGALHRGAMGSMAATWVLRCCLMAHCRIIAIEAALRDWIKIRRSAGLIDRVNQGLIEMGV